MKTYISKFSIDWPICFVAISANTPPLMKRQIAVEFGFRSGTKQGGNRETISVIMKRYKYY